MASSPPYLGPVVKSVDDPPLRSLWPLKSGITMVILKFLSLWMQKVACFVFCFFSAWRNWRKIQRTAELCEQKIRYNFFGMAKEDAHI